MTNTNRSSRKIAKAKQKENLKTLVENSSVSKARSTARIVKYGAASFKRNVWLSIAATLVMTITLIILIITICASLILSATAEAMRQKIDITVYFNPGTPAETLEIAANEMRAESNVRSVEVTDSATEYQALIAQNSEKEALKGVLDIEGMSDHIESGIPATMRIKVYNPDDFSGVKYIVENSPTFTTSIYAKRPPTYETSQSEIATITSWANVAKNGGLILSAVFLVISILVIFNTIRMAIFSRREEIHMMKLVGADTTFIRGPFLVEAQICGIISGLLASTAGYFGFKMIRENLSSYGVDVSLVDNLFMTSNLVLVYLAVIAAGMLVGTISARLAMQKYLK